MSLEITFDIPDSELKRLEEAIIRQVKENLQRQLNNDKYKILIKVRAYLEEIFWSNKVVKNLQSNAKESLRADVGVEANEMKTILDQILEALKKSIYIDDFRARKVGNELWLTSKITMVKENYADILSIQGVSYPSNDYEIPWLKWLLYNAGEFVLVTQHQILRNISEKTAKENSRSGLAIMVKSNRTVWRVPSWVFFPGHKNFIREIAENVESKMAQFISEEF